VFTLLPTEIFTAHCFLILGSTLITVLGLNRDKQRLTCCLSPYYLIVFASCWGTFFLFNQNVLTFSKIVEKIECVVLMVISMGNVNCLIKKNRC
jgi:hypothetical protein